MTASATLNVTKNGRSSNSTTSARTWQVLIDDNVVATVATNETASVSLEPGPHILRVQARSYLRSPALSFDVVKDRSSRIRVGHGRPIPFTPRAGCSGLSVCSFATIFGSVSTLTKLAPRLQRHVTWERAAAPLLPNRGDRYCSSINCPLPGGSCGSDRHDVGAPPARGAIGARRREPHQAFRKTNRLLRRLLRGGLRRSLRFLGPNGAGKTRRRAARHLDRAHLGSASLRNSASPREWGGDTKKDCHHARIAGAVPTLKRAGNLAFFAGSTGCTTPTSASARPWPRSIRVIVPTTSAAVFRRVFASASVSHERPASDPAIMFLDEPTSASIRWPRSRFTPDDGAQDEGCDNLSHDAPARRSREASSTVSPS